MSLHQFNYSSKIKNKNKNKKCNLHTILTQLDNKIEWDVVNITLSKECILYDRMRRSQYYT